jgi:hypothetical protein
MGNCLRAGSTHTDHLSTSYANDGNDGFDPLAHSGPTVKAHETLSRRELGVLAGLPRKRPVNVNSQTMHHLGVGRLANLAVGSVMESGSGCQAVDIAGSGGESWARRELGTKHAPRGTMHAQIQRVKYAQGGNCPEHASLATALLLRLGKNPGTELNAPVIRVWEGRNTLNTTYAMIGDPRVPQWGERGTVVVDPWPVVASASTLSEARMHDAKTDTWTPYRPTEGRFVDSFAPGSSEWDRMAEQVEMIEPMSSSEVQGRFSTSAAMHGRGPLQFGDELAEHALRVVGEELFDSRLGTNPSIVYTDGQEAETFDDVSTETVARLRRGLEALDRLENN